MGYCFSRLAQKVVVFSANGISLPALYPLFAVVSLSSIASSSTGMAYLPKLSRLAFQPQEGNCWLFQSQEDAPEYDQQMNLQSFQLFMLISYYYHCRFIQKNIKFRKEFLYPQNNVFTPGGYYSPFENHS